MTLSHFTHLTRRTALLLAAAALAGCAWKPMAQAPAAPQRPPIVFVHGNGDNAALWMTTLWRFESNGWPRERLHAITLPYPLAHDADDQPQPGRSSSEEARRFLAAEVDAVLQRSEAADQLLQPRVDQRLAARDLDLPAPGQAREGGQEARGVAAVAAAVVHEALRAVAAAVVAGGVAVPAHHPLLGAGRPFD